MEARSDWGTQERIPRVTETRDSREDHPRGSVNGKVLDWSLTQVRIA